MGLVWRVWESQVEPWIGYSLFGRGLQGSLQLSSAIVSGCLGLFVLRESREISSSECEVLDMLQKEAIDWYQASPALLLRSILGNGILKAL